MATHSLQRTRAPGALLAIALLAVACALVLLAGCGALSGAPNANATPNATGTAASASPSATISNPQNAQRGTLSGQIVAGPTCPVERADDPCPDKPVPNRALVIRAKVNGATTNLVSDAQGRFSLALPTGAYIVSVAAGPGMIGMRQVTSGDVVVIGGQTVTLKIVLDTGIR